MNPKPAGRTTCALEGCEVAVVRRAGGGRPRLYCSDAHRAEARRRRLAGLGGGHDRRVEGAAPVDEARELLRRALERLEHAPTEPARDDAEVAEARARATAEVLQAQQVAAEATRRAAAAEARLSEERQAWEASRRSLAEVRARDAGAIDELTGALEGTRSELEQELVRHHQDIQALEARLQAVVSARQGESAARDQELQELRDRLGGALGALEQAEQRARDAEQALRQAGEAAVALEIRAARAEEAAHQGGLRLRALEADHRQARADLAAERKHHAAIVRSLQRKTPRGQPLQRQPGGGGPSHDEPARRPGPRMARAAKGRGSGATSPSS
jgi:chromosome segregation ATPase